MFSKPTTNLHCQNANEIQQLKLKVDIKRRASDVTLEKLRANDRRENETIGAALKRYQTLPSRISIEALVGLTIFKICRIVADLSFTSFLTCKDCIYFVIQGYYYFTFRDRS